MAGAILRLAWCLTPLGMVLLAVGVVLRLLESSQQEPPGSKGSRWFLGIGAVLCIPVALPLALVLAGLEQLFH